MYTVRIRLADLACSMCAAHVTDALRQDFPQFTRIHTSAARQLCTARSPIIPDENAVGRSIQRSGYTFVALECSPARASLLERIAALVRHSQT